MANINSLSLSQASSQYVYHADNASLSPTSAFTFEAYIKTNSSVDQYVASKGGSLASGDYSWDLVIFSNNKIRFTFSSNGSSVNSIVDTGSAITQGAWFQLAVTYDGINVKIYINTSLIISQGASGAIYDSIGQLNIGASIGGGQTLDALIDDVRLWNVARSASDIAVNEQRELAGNESGLLGYWKFNNNYNDSTSNGNTLSVSGTPSFSTDLPFTDATTTSTTTTSTSSSTTTTSTSTSTTTTSTSSSTSTSRTTSTSTTATQTTTSTTSSTSTSRTTSTSTSTTTTSTSTTSTSTTLDLTFSIELV